MSIQEICELSSILDSDDREKAALQKKNVTILGSIKQQESRLQHELDEKSKFVQSLYRIDGRYQDFAADIEMTMLSISELVETRQKIENSGIISKTVHYVQTKEELEKRVCLLQSNFEELDTALQNVESRHAALTDSNPIKEKFNIQFEEKNRTTMQFRELQSQLVKTEANLAKELTSLEDFKSTRMCLINEINAIKVIRHNLETRVSSLVSESQVRLRLQEDQLRSATHHCQEVENELEMKQQTLNNVCMTCEDLKSTLSKHTDIEKLKKYQLNELEENVSCLEKEVSASEKTQADLIEDNYRRNSEIQSLKSEISSIRKTHEITKRTMNFSEKAACLEAEVVPLRKSVQEYRESIDRLYSELSGEKVTQQQQRIDLYLEENLRIESELAAITDKHIPHMQREIEAAAAEVSATTSELAITQSQVTELQQKKLHLLDTLQRSESILKATQEAFCTAMNAATKDINLTKESSSSMSSLTADEVLLQMENSAIIKENAVSELSTQLAAEQSSLNTLKGEILQAEAEAEASLMKERANWIRKKKVSYVSQKRDELSRLQQAELGQLRKTLTEGDLAFRQKLQKNQAMMRQRAEEVAHLEQQAASLRVEHAKQMELLRISSEGHHPLLDSSTSSDQFSNGLMNLMAMQCTNDSQVSALTPVDKWAVVLPSASSQNAQAMDCSITKPAVTAMEDDVDLFVSQEDADIMAAAHSQSSEVQATAATTDGRGKAKTRPREGGSRSRSGGRGGIGGESSQSPHRDDRGDARTSRRRKKSTSTGRGHDERADPVALSQQPRAGSQEDDGKGRSVARMRSSRAAGK